MNVWALTNQILKDLKWGGIEKKINFNCKSTQSTLIQLLIYAVYANAKSQVKVQDKYTAYWALYYNFGRVLRGYSELSALLQGEDNSDLIIFTV